MMSAGKESIPHIPCLTDLKMSSAMDAFVVDEASAAHIPLFKFISWRADGDSSPLGTPSWGLPSVGGSCPTQGYTSYSVTGLCGVQSSYSPAFRRDHLQGHGRRAPWGLPGLHFYSSQISLSVSSSSILPPLLFWGAFPNQPSALRSPQRLFSWGTWPKTACSHLIESLFLS